MGNIISYHKAVEGPHPKSNIEFGVNASFESLISLNTRVTMANERGKMAAKYAFASRSPFTTTFFRI
jgi:hypothetical protein